MSNYCAECHAIGLEMRAALAEVQQHPDPTLVANDVRERLKELFASEESIADLSESIHTSRLGEAYSRWRHHRIATGHTGEGIGSLH